MAKDTLRRWTDLDCEMDLGGSVCRIRLKRCDGKGNALNESLVTQLAEAFSCVETSPAKIVLVQSADPTCFSAGIDLEEMEKELKEGGDCKARFLALTDLFDQMSGCHAYIIGVAQGVARGAGATLLLACDHIVVDAKGFSLAHPEKKFNMLPWLSILHLLRRFCGGYEALRRYINGTETWKAEACLAAGLVDESWLGGGIFETHVDSVVAQQVCRVEGTCEFKRQFQKPSPFDLPEDGEVDELLRITTAYLRGEAPPRSLREFREYCVVRLSEMAKDPQTLASLSQYVEKMKKRQG